MSAKITEIYDKHCNQCNLGATCTNRCLPGIGGQGAKLLIIGSYPSVEDDQRGRITKEGSNKYLYKILEDVIGVDPEDAYYTYLVKCRSDLKGLTPENIQICREYLKSEIALLQPKVILTLGKLPYLGLTGEEVSVNKIRGEFRKVTLQLWDDDSYEVDVMPTLHISYALKLNNPQPVLKKIGMDIYKAYCKANDIEAGGTDTEIVWVESLAHMEQLIDDIISVGICCFDYESNGLEHYKDIFKLTLLSISYQIGCSHVIPLNHFDSDNRDIDSETRGTWYKYVEMFYNRVILNPDVIKIGQNIKYDLHCFGFLGFTGVRGRLEDTMFQRFLIDDKLDKGLKQMTADVFPQFAGYEDEVGKYKWGEQPLKPLGVYGGADTDLTLRHWLYQTEELLQNEDVYRCYRNILLPALKTAYEIECRGIHIERTKLEEGIKLGAELIELQLGKLISHPVVNKFEIHKLNRLRNSALIKINARLKKWQETHHNPTKTEEKLVTQIEDIKTGAAVVYEGFNFNSNKQLEELLYDETGFNFEKPFNYKTKKYGGTGVDVLNELPDKSGFMDTLLEYRSLCKTYGTYLKGFETLLDNNDRLHPTFHITGTRTGRMSSSNPNVQNITQPDRIKYPNAKKAAGYIKEMFTVPDNDTVMVQVDFSQMELRLVAWYAQCKTMLDAYDRGEDLHALTAANVNGMTLEEFKKLPKDKYKLLRFQAKAVNFGFIYGATAETFRHYAKSQYSIVFSVKQAEKIRSNFFKAYPELLRYHRHMVRLAKTQGHISTLLGSQRNMKDIYSRNNRLKSHAERTAINTPIQGTSGQLTIFAMNLLRDRVDKRVKMWNSVHDSIIFYMPKLIYLKQCKLIKITCEKLPLESYFGVTLKTNEGWRGVSMKVDFELSNTSWKHLQEIELN